MRFTVKPALATLGAILCGALVIGAGIGTTTVMPDYAPVYIDDASRTYLAAPCEPEWRKRNDVVADQLRFGTALEARRLKYKPDDYCRNTGLHAPEGRSALGLLLEKLGFLSPLEYWWDKM